MVACSQNNICVTNNHGYVPLFVSASRSFFSFVTYHRVCNKINTTRVTSGAGTAYPSGEPEFTTGFQWGSCYSIFSLICMFCWSLFVLLYFFFWPLCCLFFDIRILITPLVFSNLYILHITKSTTVVKWFILFKWTKIIIHHLLNLLIHLKPSLDHGYCD